MVHSGHAIREGNWKLARNARQTDAAEVAQEKFELYNLAKDPGEKENVANEHPQITGRLFSQFSTYAENRKLKK